MASSRPRGPTCARPRTSGRVQPTPGQTPPPCGLAPSPSTPVYVAQGTRNILRPTHVTVEWIAEREQQAWSMAANIMSVGSAQSQLHLDLAKFHVVEFAAHSSDHVSAYACLKTQESKAMLKQYHSLPYSLHLPSNISVVRLMNRHFSCLDANPGSVELVLSY